MIENRLFLTGTRETNKQNVSANGDDDEKVMSDIYARGDHLMKLFIVIHFLFAMLLAGWYSTWLITFVVGGSAALLFFVAARLLPRSLMTRCIAGVSLQAFVALHIFQMHGLAEMHFFFFTAFTMMIVYQDWRSMWPGALIIIGQHILFAVLTNNGTNLFFFDVSYIEITKLVFHFGIALVEVAVCGYWSVILKRQTIKDARQQAALQTAQASLEEQVTREQQVNVVLEGQQAQLAAHQTQLMHANAKLAEANSQLEQANEHLFAQASTDGLTGLCNHRMFQERLTEEVYRSRRYQHPLSLLLIDVDRFKLYNDSFGHPEGDNVLRAVARLLQSTVRECDLVARYGGEEFAIILPNTESDASCCTAERIRVAIASASWPMRAVTISTGISTLSEQMKDKSDLIAEADRALYRSKQRGRDCSTHAEDKDEQFSFIAGNTQPYTEILREMLLTEDHVLTSASEHIKNVILEGYDRTIQSWAKLLDMKDKETEGHSMRVTELMERLAHFVGMNGEETMYAYWGAMLHDIGKMGIPDAILLKPGKLTEVEWEVIRRHPSIAHEMLSPITFLRTAIDIPYCHHEKWDGTGYPQGLQGDAIPLAARLFAVIDVYDALRFDRPDRKRWTEAKIVKYLRSQSGSHFDPRAVDAFLAMLKLENEAATRVAA